MSRKEYQTVRWRRLRRKVFERDGFRCQKCGKAGRLECDHRNPVRKLKDPEQFWEPSHLQALCRSCHIQKTRVENRAANEEKNPQKAEWQKFVSELT